jgi:predicted nucleic acid-binding protein
VRALVDTSVLVAAFLADHPHHSKSLDLLLSLDQESGCAAHTLLEFYATLTRLPGRQRVEIAHVLLMIEEIRRRLSVWSLDAAGYTQVIANCAGRALAGGAVYDALIAQCAVQAGAAAVYTWNVRDFPRLGLPAAIQVATP